jgi:uncharacterized membrane protein
LNFCWSQAKLATAQQPRQARLATPDPAPFAPTWKLQHHSALSAQGRWLALLLVASGAGLTGLVGLVIGAWPVFVYAGLEIALLALAFRLVARNADREQIFIDGDTIVLTRVRAGRTSEHRFNRQWATLVVRERGVRFDMSLRYGGKVWPVARIATDRERCKLASELGRFVRVERQ